MRAMELVNAEGEPRRPLLDEFFVAPETDVQRENDLKAGEVVTAVLLPALAAGARSAHLREADKQAFDWPIADVAVALDRDEEGRCRRASVVLGAAAPVPRRARATEDLLVGKVVDGTWRARPARPRSRRPRRFANHYKLPIFAALVRRALLRAASQG